MPKTQLPGMLQACAWGWVEGPSTKPGPDDMPLIGSEEEKILDEVNREIECYGFTIRGSPGEGGIYWSDAPAWRLMYKDQWPAIVRGTFRQCCQEVVRWLEKGLVV